MGKIGKTRSWLLALGGAYLAYRWYKQRNASSLQDQVVLITGGSRGLGLEMARVFAGEGARLAICARDPQELDAARQELEERGAEVLALVCDVADQEAVTRMVVDVEAFYGRLDVLVNNAGIIQVGPIACMTPRDFEEIMDIVFKGALYATFAALPGMRRRGYGRLVNIVSIGGRVPAPHMIPYDAAKFALRGFSEGLRTELSADGIHVTTILPGLMRTGSPVNALFKGRQEWEFTWFAIADSLPLLSMDSRKAAERIVLACRRGETEVTLTGRARLLGLAHDLAPSFTLGALSLANRLLPRANGAGHATARGMDLVSPLAPSILTHWTNEAAKRNNQFGGMHAPDPCHAARMGLTSAPTAETLERVEASRQPGAVFLFSEGVVADEGFPTYD